MGLPTCQGAAETAHEPRQEEWVGLDRTKRESLSPGAKQEDGDEGHIKDP